MQLACTYSSIAYFVMWTPSEFHIEEVQRDDRLLSEMIPALRSYYFDHLLPVLAAESFLVTLQPDSSFSTETPAKRQSEPNQSANDAEDFLPTSALSL